MSTIKAIWTNGQILPTEPVDWPEGRQLLVEPAPRSEEIGVDESTWDDPDSIAAWAVAVESIEPLIWTDGEEREYERFREKFRLFNLEAVRMQMEAMSEGEAS